MDLGGDYQEIQGKWCTPEGFEYQTVEEAKVACSNDIECKMFYDERGDERPPFVICSGDSVQIKSSNVGSVLYSKGKG